MSRSNASTASRSSSLQSNVDQVVEAIRTHFHPEQIIVTAAGDFEG